MIRLLIPTAAFVAGNIDPVFQSWRAHMAASAAALRSGDVRLARSWLEQAPCEHRGWERYCLEAEGDHSLAFFRASDQSITKVQVSPDGVIRLWHTTTHATRGELKGHTASVFGLLFSGDGARLVSTSRDNPIRLWDVARRVDVGGPATKRKAHSRKGPKTGAGPAMPAAGRSGGSEESPTIQPLGFLSWTFFMASA